MIIETEYKQCLRALEQSRTKLLYSHESSGGKIVTTSFTSECPTTITSISN